MKLLTKYSLISVILMVVIFIASATVLYQFTEKILTDEIKADLKGVRGRLIHYTQVNGKFPLGYALDEVQLVYAPLTRPIPDTCRLTKMYSPREKKMHNFMKMQFPLTVGNKPYAVTIARPLEGMHHVALALITISILTILIIILLELVLNRLLLKKLWRPFYHAMEELKRFRVGSIRQPEFAPTSIKEFMSLNENLAHATSRALRDYHILKEFTENASHEIQTPLSIIRSKLDLLIQEKTLSEIQLDLTASAAGAAKKLSRLNSSLLLLAKIENQQFNNRQQIDLSYLLHEKCDHFRELWEARGIVPHIHIEGQINMTFDPELADILLNNLLGNATNHNVENGSVSITARQGSIEVANSGMSQPLDEKKIFTRFYKPAGSTSNNGLGLSIIKQISQLAGFTVNYSYTQSRHAFILSW